LKEAAAAAAGRSQGITGKRLLERSMTFQLPDFVKEKAATRLQVSKKRKKQPRGCDDSDSCDEQPLGCRKPIRSGIVLMMHKASASSSSTSCRLPIRKLAERYEP
jgi:hypothetical protein